MAQPRIQYDVVLVGGSPSNLALAHRLVDKALASGTRFSLAILEKSKEFGGHICSGAVVQPRVLKTLFPNWEADKLPIEAVCSDSHFSVLGEQSIWNAPNLLLPAGLRKEGYWVLTLSMVVAWMVEQLKKKLKDQDHLVVDFFPGFSAHEVLYEGSRVVGVTVSESLEGVKEPNDHQVFGRVVGFGDKGFVSGGLVKKLALRPNPQIWSVGVKEVWSLPKEVDYSGHVWHTMGYPLVDGSFGGGFVYGMKNNRVSVGLIASLDSPNPNLNPQQLLQAYKAHPWMQAMLAEGKLMKYGAALLPEGGYYSLPSQFAVDGALLLGDALGVLDVSSLNGVANSMECGLLAADVLHDLLESGHDFTAANLKPYQHKVMTSEVGQSLKQGRYFRKAWQENPRLLTRYLPEVMQGVDQRQPWLGVVKVGLKNNPITALKDAGDLAVKIEGLWDLGPVAYEPDHTHIDPKFQAEKDVLGQPFHAAKDTVYTREDAVFYAGPRYHHGNDHIDEFNAETCVACITQYDALGRDVPCVSDCTAEVHRIDLQVLEAEAKAAPVSVRVHGMSLENCIQCRTCEIVCPEQNLKVRPTEQGAGPDFMGL